MKRWGAVVAAVGGAVLIAACGDQSTLSPDSPAARDIRTLWWWMLVVAGIVFFGAVAMLALAWFRRGEPGLPILGESEKTNNRLVVAFGIAIPMVVLVALFAVANLYLTRHTEPPAASSTTLTIQVTGHQWFWEVRYPDTTAVTANEIHIPAETRVNVEVRSDDVIHSFWVPELNRKIDMVPGHPNSVLLYADHPGVYNGICAEFCGLQHAHMAFKVFAEPADEFESWLDEQGRPATSPQAPEAQRGEQLFLANACSECHTIRGTEAQGTIGPDLTHVAGRTTLAGATIPNTPAELERWISDPQHIKPGNKMPGLNLSDREFAAIADYLAGLR